VGAQVMCVKNRGGHANLVNGSIGIVTNFMIPMDARNSRKDDPNGPKSYPYISIESDLEPKPKIDPKTGHESRPPPNYVYEGTGWPVVKYGDEYVLMGPWQTLDRVKVDLRGTFESGQAYVALSRCTSLEGLEVQNFFPRVVMADLRVVEWTRSPVTYGSKSRSPPRYKRPVRKPAPPPFGKFQNKPQLYRASLSQGTGSSSRGIDDEEEIAAQLYHDI
ncbi:hypothetical protein FRC07_011301, partial [Ceratobasidium sp. 392]